MQNNKALLIVVIFVAALLAGAAAYLYFQNRQAETEAGRMQAQLQAQREAGQLRAAALEGRIDRLEDELKKDDPALDEGTLQEVFGGDNGTGDADDAASAGEDDSVRVRVMNFFRYIDGREYLQKHGIQIGSHALCLQILQRLDASRPVISGEAQDLFTLMKNVTFFFRILGKDTVLALKDIVEDEAAIMEPTMALFYDWLNPWQPQPGEQLVSREVMYEYAGFFLQTMAGQAYLFRRELGVRTLMAYYSLLVLDQANRSELNQHGIDIRPHIDALLSDLAASRRLADRRRYMEVLQEMRGRYENRE